MSRNPFGLLQQRFLPPQGDSFGHPQHYVQSNSLAVSPGQSGSMGPGGLMGMGIGGGIPRGGPHFGVGGGGHVTNPRHFGSSKLGTAMSPTIWGGGYGGMPYSPKFAGSPAGSAKPSTTSPRTQAFHGAIAALRDPEEEEEFRNPFTPRQFLS